MEVLRCVQCKGEIALEKDGLIGRCLSCGTVYHFKNEKNSRIIALLNQANISRLRGDYDGAILAYKIALTEDETDADAYWGLTLSVFGIEYIEDDRTGRLIPTCRRTISHSILTDSNYLKAIKFASERQAKQFEKQAEEIERLQEGIKEKASAEKDFDVFICFKSTDRQGNPTKDRFIARQIYDELSKREIRTFFSEISLKDRLGEDYEPIIYKALYTCKYFILVGTQEDYVQAPWVKNEWARFRDRMKDEGFENAAFAVFKNLKPNQLPPIFRSQGIDLAKYPAGGYEIEIADNLQTRLNKNKYKTFGSKLENDNSFMFEDKMVDLLDKKLVGTRQTYEERVDRALAYYEIGNKNKAISILEEIIDEYPRKAMGWFYKAKLLTNNFEGSIIDFHLNENLHKEVEFMLKNATRFATEDEREIILKEAGIFIEKADVLNKIDENLENLETKLEDYCLQESELAKLEKQKTEAAKKESSGLEKAYKKNESKIKELRKHTKRKSYYIKNIASTPSFVYSFLNFIGFTVIITAIIGTYINVIRLLRQTKPITYNIVFEFVLLLIVGLMPFILVHLLSKGRKLRKVKSVIEADKQKLARLKEENDGFKKKLVEFDKTAKQKEKEIKDKYDWLLGEFKITKKYLVSSYFEVKNLVRENDFIYPYLESYEEFSKESLDQRIKDNQVEIDRLLKERDKIYLENENNKKDLLRRKPKYFSQDYEKLCTKVNLLIRKNKERIEDIKERVEDLELEVRIFNFQKQKTFISEDFLTGFANKDNIPKEEKIRKEKEEKQNSEEPLFEDEEKEQEKGDEKPLDKKEEKQDKSKILKDKLKKFKPIKVKRDKK